MSAWIFRIIWEKFVYCRSYDLLFVSENAVSCAACARIQFICFWTAQCWRCWLCCAQSARSSVLQSALPYFAGLRLQGTVLMTRAWHPSWFWGYSWWPFVFPALQSHCLSLLGEWVPLSALFFISIICTHRWRLIAWWSSQWELFDWWWTLEKRDLLVHLLVLIKADLLCLTVGGFSCAACVRNNLVIFEGWDQSGDCFCHSINSAADSLFSWLLYER